MTDAPDNTRNRDTAPGSAGRLLGWFQELRRRHIFKVTVAYLVIAWLLMQVASVLEASLKLPDWTDKLTFLILVVGFPIALILTWAVDLTPASKALSNDKLSDIGKEYSTLEDRSVADRIRDDVQQKAMDNIRGNIAIPSIAVLPFQNMSGDPEQEYFADGISEDIITALARVRQLFVMARNTTFTFKGKAVDIQQVARDLGVRYVLEGSVRKIGNRIRITAQLIEGSTGNHIWAEKYDRDLDDTFAVQDEITRVVVGTVIPTLSRFEQEKINLKKPNELSTWELHQKGLWHFWKLTPNDVKEAEKFFSETIEKDPAFAPAYASKAYVHVTNLTRGYTDDPHSEIKLALQTAHLAVKLDVENALSHWSLGVASMFNRDFETALEELSTAQSLNPSFAPAFAQYGLALAFCGRASEAFPFLDEAERISPLDTSGWLIWFGRGWAYFFVGDFELATVSARRAIKGAPAFVWAHSIFVAALASMNRHIEAKEAIQELFLVEPRFSIKFINERSPLDDERRKILISALIA